MIRQLSIQGLAIIDSLEIEFTPGFNVITGETGAGKSILIRALNFLAGGKAVSDVVRQGFDAAVVSGEFEVLRDHRAVEVLERLGIPLPEGKKITLLLRRLLHSKGRSQAWINDVPVAVPSLKLVGATLVDVFAQHENQRLLHAESHIDYVDSFIGNPKQRAMVSEIGKAVSDRLLDLKQRLDSLEGGRRQSDYLSFRYEQLKEFAPSAEDYETVNAYCERAEAFRKHRDPLSAALGILEGSGEAASPGEQVREAAKLLPDLVRRQRLLACATEIDDVGFDLGRQLQSMDFDEELLNTSQARLFGYQDLFRKHGVRAIPGLLEELKALETQLSDIHGASDSFLAELEALHSDALLLKKACAQLSVARLQAAQNIKHEVEGQLAELHMPGCIFQAEFEAIDRTLPNLRWEGLETSLCEKWEAIRPLLQSVSSEGSERAQFLLSANPGEPPLPLAKVASGGELSRIMLALKKALAADAETCVLVFDEIDSGISGRVADVVGRKMRELASTVQVLCISHLPQVAVYADCHFLVTKKGKGDRTQSSILPLSEEESAREIARLLSGRDVSSTSLANAKQLISSARGKSGGKALKAKSPSPQPV